LLAGRKEGRKRGGGIIEHPQGAYIEEYQG
jgi:hypothetical protein